MRFALRRKTRFFQCRIWTVKVNFALHFYPSFSWYEHVLRVSQACVAHTFPILWVMHIKEAGPQLSSKEKPPFHPKLQCKKSEKSFQKLMSMQRVTLWTIVNQGLWDNRPLKKGLAVSSMSVFDHLLLILSQFLLG